MKIILPDGSVEEAKDELRAIRHTASHVLAQAVKRLYPETKLAIGPAIDDGFYYDFDREGGFTPDDLEKLEAEMKKIVKENLALKPFVLPRDEAIKFMQEKGEPYKVELIEDLPEGETISFYQQGDFVDLCAGPHILYTKGIKAFKLTSIAGAYWRGSEKNKMLTRIYGTAFAKKEDLEAYLTMMEEAKKRDHRKLGKELGLFMFAEEGPGFPFFLPKGMTLKNTLIDYWREIHHKAGYVEISTPLIMNKQLKIEADLVVLAAAIEPDKSARPLATMLTASMDTNDFFTEAHPKLRPVESPTAGVFLSGMCQGPKDIPETVAQASAAAAKVIGLLCKDSLTCNPCVAQPDEMMCNGCSNCEKVCPYGAITYIDKEFRGPNRTTLVRRVAQVNPAVCQGCGACTVACMSGAMDLKGFSNRQIIAEVDAICR